MKKLVLIAALLIPGAANAADLKTVCVNHMNLTIRQVKDSVFQGQQQPICDCVVADVTATSGDVQSTANEIDAYYNRGTGKETEAMSVYQKALSVCAEKVVGRAKVEEESRKVSGPYKQR